MADGGARDVGERADVRVVRASYHGDDGDEASDNTRGGDCGVVVGDDVYESVGGGVDDDDVYVGVCVDARMLSKTGRAKVGKNRASHRPRIEMGDEIASEAAAGVGVVVVGLDRHIFSSREYALGDSLMCDAYVPHVVTLKH